MYECMSVCMDGWMDGWVDGWMDAVWKDGWMDGWMDNRPSHGSKEAFPISLVLCLLFSRHLTKALESKRLVVINLFRFVHFGEFSAYIFLLTTRSIFFSCQQSHFFFNIICIYIAPYLVIWAQSASHHYYPSRSVYSLACSASWEAFSVSCHFTVTQTFNIPLYHSLSVARYHFYTGEGVGKKNRNKVSFQRTQHRAEPGVRTHNQAFAPVCELRAKPARPRHLSTSKGKLMHATHSYCDRRKLFLSH